MIKDVDNFLGAVFYLGIVFLGIAIITGIVNVYYYLGMFIYNQIKNPILGTAFSFGWILFSLIILLWIVISLLRRNK